MREATAIKVIGLFEKHGKEPGADFDEDYFFDFLIKCSLGNCSTGLRIFPYAKNASGKRPACVGWVGALAETRHGRLKCRVYQPSLPPLKVAVPGAANGIKSSA
jgi:hypothetical protein